MINRQNYLDRRDYLEYHKKSRQNIELSVQQYEWRLRYALNWCDSTSFSESFKCKISFPEYVSGFVERGELSPSLASRICHQFRDLLNYEKSENPQRYSKIKQSYIDSIIYTVKSDKTKQPDAYTLDDMKKIASFNPKTLTERRIQAGACFLFLTGMRISAFLSIPIECVDIENDKIMQYPSKGVYTKFNKTADTVLFKVPEIPELLEIVKEWDSFVRSECPAGSTWYVRIDPKGNRDKIKPLFPELDMKKASKKTAGRKKTFYKGLKAICDAVGIEYKNPHAFRHGIAHYALSKAKTPEDFKVISTNLMHDSTEITDRTYSQLDINVIRETLSNFGKTPQKDIVSSSPVSQNNGVTDYDLMMSLPVEVRAQILREKFGLV